MKQKKGSANKVKKINHSLIKNQYMKSYAFFILSFIFFISKGLAQRELNLADHDEKPYYFGITLGGNTTHFHTSKHYTFLDNDSVASAEPLNSGGFQLGLLATARINDQLALRFNPTLLFYERSIQYTMNYPIDGSTFIKKTVESTTFSFPFQLKFQSDRIHNFRVYTIAGIKADIDMASNARKRKAEDLIKINKNDTGLELGMGFNFYFKSFVLSPEVKISHGVKNIHNRDPNLIYSSTFDKLMSRMIIFSFHIEG